MAIYLNPETVSMFLLGVGLVSLARFGRMFFNRHDPNKTLFSDNLKKLWLRDGVKLKFESIRQKEERLILESKKYYLQKKQLIT